jgi:hypothetical protein
MGKQDPDIFHFPPFPADERFTRNADAMLEDCILQETAKSGRAAWDMDGIKHGKCKIFNSLKNGGKKK